MMTLFKKNIFALVKLLPAVVLWLTLIGPAAAAEFVDGIEDVPVMNGMHQVQSNNISFGNDEIRFVEAYLSGRKATFSSVAAFYEETLPQLGWHFIGRRNDSLHFERDAERLDIVRENKSPLLVRITLKSKE